MKRVISPSVSLFLLVTVVGVSQSEAQKTSSQLLQEGYKRYGLESGIFELLTESSMMKSTEIIHFDRWGLRETKERTTEIKAGTFTQNQHSMELLDGETTVTVDLDSKRGSRITNNLMTTIIDRTSSRDMEEAGQKILKSMGGKRVGEESVLGKSCQVWEIQSLKTKTWVWKNIGLKSESGFGGMTTKITAVRVEENVKIPEEKFRVPEGIPITESGSIPDVLKGIKDKQKAKGK